MPKMKITKTAVEKLPMEEKRVDWFDSELTGFGVRVSSTAKAYFVIARVGGSQKRVTLGKHPVMSAEKARTEAMKTLAQMNEGVDPNKKKALDRVRGLSLEDVHDKYLASRPNMKSHSIAVDKSLLKCHLSDWLKKPIQEISRDMVSQRHLKIAKSTGTNSANNAMRLFRRLYNYAVSLSDGDMPPNPVLRLSDSRQWFKVSRRQTVLKEHELPLWYDALQKLDNPAIADYLLLLLLTGLRKNEGISISWSSVDMKDKSFTITDTKNGKPHMLPMSDMLHELFSRRLKQRENGYVFPGPGKKGHLIEPKKQVAAIDRITCLVNNNLTSEEELTKLKTKSPDKVVPGIKFCLHDLRRTFASIAEGVVSYSVLKRLMNHSDNDVTQGYIVLNVDKLRQPMQQVTDTIRTAMGAPRPETQEEAGQESSDTEQQK